MILHSVNRSYSSSDLCNHRSLSARLCAFTAIDSPSIMTIPFRQPGRMSGAKSAVLFSDLIVVRKIGSVKRFGSNSNAQCRFSSTSFVWGRSSTWTHPAKATIAPAITDPPRSFGRRLYRHPSKTISLHLENLITCKPVVFIAPILIPAYKVHLSQATTLRRNCTHSSVKLFPVMQFALGC